MSKIQKCVLGGLGGVSPLIVNILAIDYHVTFTDFSINVALGYLLRVLILFFVGGLIAYLHNENNKIRIFEIGIIAPAILIGYINGSSALKVSSNVVGELICVSTIYAQTSTDIPEKISVPKESGLQQFQRGLFGSKANINDSLVIVGKSMDIEKIRDLKDQLTNAYKMNDLKIFESSKTPNMFYLSAGSYVNEQNGNDIEKRIESQIPKGVVQSLNVEVKKVDSLK
jgi:hypothetical protein